MSLKREDMKTYHKNNGVMKTKQALCIITVNMDMPIQYHSVQKLFQFIVSACITWTNHKHILPVLTICPLSSFRHFMEPVYQILLHTFHTVFPRTESKKWSHIVAIMMMTFAD